MPLLIYIRKSSGLTPVKKWIKASVSGDDKTPGVSTDRDDDEAPMRSNTERDARFASFVMLIAS